MHETYTCREQTLGFLVKRAICRFDVDCNRFGAYLLQLRVGRLCVQQHGMRVRVTRDQRRALTRQGAGSVERKAANSSVRTGGFDIPESRAHA